LLRKGSDNSLINSYAALIEALSPMADFEYVVALIKIELIHRMERIHDFNKF